VAVSCTRRRARLRGPPGIPRPPHKVHDTGTSGDASESLYVERELAKLRKDKYNRAVIGEDEPSGSSKSYGPSAYRSPGRSGKPQNPGDLRPGRPRAFGAGPGDGSEG